VERDFSPAEADDPRYDPDVTVLLVKKRSLFDVKFERGVVLILRLCGDLTAVTNPLKLIFEPVSCGVVRVSYASSIGISPAQTRLTSSRVGTEIPPRLSS